jgi:hypothetical protein
MKQPARVDHAAGQQGEAVVEHAAHGPQAAELVDVQADLQDVKPAQVEGGGEEGSEWQQSRQPQ